MDQVAELIARLNRDKKLRVWSVIITFFGDAIVPRGGSVSAKTVQTLLARMGIEAGAVRTAFSRLSNDGWVVREKRGRSSFYRLSKTGLQPFAEATDLIYAPLPAAPSNDGRWKLSLSEASYPLPRIERLSGGCGADGEGDPNDFELVGTVRAIPRWMKQMHCSDAHHQAYATLMQAFAPVQPEQMSNEEAMAIRCLLIHEWRRILFQFDAVPPDFWTDDWPQAACHAFVSQLYGLLLPASERWMTEVANGLDGALPPVSDDLARRFH